jgi:hypothetical protein
MLRDIILSIIYFYIIIIMALLLFRRPRRLESGVCYPENVTVCFGASGSVHCEELLTARCV